MILLVLLAAWSSARRPVAGGVATVLLTASCRRVPTGHRRPRRPRVRQSRQRPAPQCRRRRPDRRPLVRADNRHPRFGRHADRPVDTSADVPAPTSGAVHRATADGRHQRHRHRLVSRRGPQRPVPRRILGPGLRSITADHGDRCRRSGGARRRCRRDGHGPEAGSPGTIIGGVGDHRRAHRRHRALRAGPAVQCRCLHACRVGGVPRRRSGRRRGNDGRRQRHERERRGRWPAATAPTPGPYPPRRGRPFHRRRRSRCRRPRRHHRLQYR